MNKKANTRINSNGVKEKSCTTCREYLPQDLQHFFRDQRTFDGLAQQCKLCRGINRRKYAVRENRWARERYKEKKKNAKTN